MTTDILNNAESKRLAALEAVITKGKRAFVEVGQALSEIRDAKLYRSEHKTFEAYVQARWGWGKSYAYRLMDAAEVKTSPIGDKITNEAQAREVASVPAEKRERVVEAAATKAEAEGRDMTARDIREAAVEVVPEPPKLTPEELDTLRAGAEASGFGVTEEQEERYHLEAEFRELAGEVVELAKHARANGFNKAFVARLATSLTKYATQCQDIADRLTN